MMDGRRLFDVFASSAALLAVWPVFLVAGLLIKLEDGGPAFFRQERVGRDGRLFTMWKLRTMKVNAGVGGPQLTVAGDTRITRIGGWLRDHKLDELPQLLNVLRGEMAIVGPRPELPRYVAMYTADQRKVLALRPGITDPSSVLFANESELLASAADPERYYIERIVPEKIRMALEYADHATALRDIGVVVATLGEIFPKKRTRLGTAT